MIEYRQFPLWERELIFKRLHKDLPQVNYAIVWEDPAEPEAPVQIARPSPTWLAMALHGGILPPVEVYHRLRADEEQPGFKRHTRGYLLHEVPPIKAMTEEEAMEYLVKKELPLRVWRDYRGNRQLFKIVPVRMIPTDRTLRDAWRIKQEAA